MAVLTDMMTVYLISFVVICHIAQWSCNQPDCSKAPAFLPDYLSIIASYLDVYDTLTQAFSEMMSMKWIEVLSMLGVIAIIAENLLLVYWTINTVTTVLNWAASFLLIVMLFAAGLFIFLIYVPDSIPVVWAAAMQGYEGFNNLQSIVANVTL